MSERDNEKREGTLILRIRPSLKEDAKKRAEAEGRSLSNYIEWLITKDIKENK